ncbi:type II secretion system minor pseudopilin GspK [Inmirania thermothiophila]|uniref:Type II secretion system protein K n=1 Tax=Inmirania thermothiophila TaxID=1750597 RepID=A0A3N1XSE9_9GAMM|nr:type II secretion system minor pseudopilin GspK [Inmirania thermothiophila]ROR29564.1 general secretion pathway protein K [Inmirania thermothiophila]
MGRERGMALVLAMLVVALAATAAAAAAWRGQVAVRRTELVVQRLQAAEYARAAVAWAGRILARDRDEGPVDHPGEDWARRLPPLAVEGGAVSGYIEDMQGRLNLNNLVDEEGRPREAEVERLRRLLRVLELDPALADAVVDWIDPDTEPHGTGGAEDETYGAMDPPYHAANGPMQGIAELALVAGFDAETRRRLAPHVTALPEPTPVNVNTATPEVLRSLADGIDADTARALVEARGAEGWDRVETFLRAPPLAGLGLRADGLAVGSAYFLVHAEARVGRTAVRQRTLLHRGDDGRVRVVAAGRGGLPWPG